MIGTINEITGYIMYPVVISITSTAICLLIYRVLRHSDPEYDFSDYLENYRYFTIVGISSVFILILSITFLIAFNSYNNKLCRNEIKAKVTQIADKDFKMCINDTLVPKNDSLIKAFADIKRYNGNRPNGSKNIYLTFSYKDITIPLHLIRDSDRKTLYWVYYDVYEKSGMEAGKINTSYFNAYK